MTQRRDPELLLRRWWEEGPPRPLGAVLSLASVAYRMGMAVRARAYDWGGLPSGRLPCPVVSVGNITLGGSGKTPTVELVVRSLRDMGAVPAVVSRGYGRETRGVLVVADRAGIRLGPRQAGDEPLLLADHLPGVPVVVGENRLEAGRVAVERCGASVVVLDDGFQHRTVAKDLEVLVVNGRAPWGNGRLFPRGMLREPLGALARAHLVVVANPGAPSDVEAVAAALKRYHARAPIVTAAYRVGEAQEMRSGHRTGAAALAGRRLLAFCGLGSPRGFAETLERLGVELAGVVEFPDHYWFAARDLYELDRHAQTVRAEGLITTEKDWVRLRELHLPPTPLWVLPARLHLESGHEAWAQALGRLVAPSSARR